MFSLIHRLPPSLEAQGEAVSHHDDPELAGNVMEEGPQRF